MAVFKCKMCGGDLNIIEGSTVAECEYCYTKQTVPAADDEKKMTLFSRANRLRFNCEFDKAAGVYESIVADFSEEAEAYWGLLLCKYGIEYVDDPATGKKIPTCHRSSFDSVMEDPDFDMVMEYADALSRKVYREEAKTIEGIRKGIIEVSSKEEPYDIFICYKETDENGDRTLDSVIAQDVYEALIEKGYRVFFSRITLEDKLGVEYEPYIFAALNSAKLMLVFGTDYEYFNAVWVKNEWSRFLQLIAAGQKKTLIPCFKNLDAYDMPKEFAKLQSQDMGKVGAIQDLLRGIEKILPRAERNEKTADGAEKQNTNASVIKEIALADGSLFTGEGIAGKPHGRGKCIYPNGDTYEGAWAFGKYNGSGILTYSDGASWSGEWKEGKRFNGSGKEECTDDNGKPDGSSYTGEIKDGKRTGHGIFVYANGDSYEGEFLNGSFNGQGTLNYADGGTWTGEWKGGQRFNGKGKVIYLDKNGVPDGNCYAGEIKNGLRNGQGIMIYADGSNYQGDWKENKKEGRGKLLYNDGSVWVGEWKDDNPWNGTGKLITLKDGKPDGSFYQGDCENGKRNGRGSFFWPNGDKYVGEYKDGVKHGKGIYIWSDNDKYEGEWKNDKRNGQGTYTHADGKTWSGIWKNGKPFNGTGWWKGRKLKLKNGLKSVF